MLKKSPNAKLTKFYTYFDGNISVVGGGDGKKVKVTSIWEREEGGGGRSRAARGAPGGGRARRGWQGAATSTP